MTDLRELLKLPVAERLQLIDDLWDSIETDLAGGMPLSDAQREELDRRFAEHKADPTSAQGWSDVRAELWAKYKK